MRREKRSSVQIVIGGNSKEPPSIKEVIKPNEAQMLKLGLAKEGITTADLTVDTKRVKTVLKRMPFLKDSAAVPGSRGIFRLIFAGSDQRMGQGGLHFAFGDS